MADGEEDFSQLELTDRCSHKNWKVRKEGYEEAARQFEKTPDESDPVFRPFLQDSGIWKAAAGDSNVAAQQEGLGALCAFLKYGGQQGASRSRPQTIQPIYEKGLQSTRPAIKTNSIEALLLYVEIDKPDLVIDDLLPALSHKQPKVIAATLAALTAIYHNFGIRVVEPKPVLKSLPKVYAHADKKVREEAQNLTVELYRWLKEAMKPIFWNELKDVQQKDLEKLFEKVKAEPSPKQERFTRAQQAQMATATPTVGDKVGGEAVVVEPEEEEAVEVDAFDLAEPVDAYSKVPADFHEMISSTKWKDRKDTLDAFFNVVNTPRLKDGPYHEVVQALAKCMKDANIAVVTVAANCIEKLAQGLRKGFAKHRSTVMSPIMERLKEKKTSVTDALGAALDAVFTSTSLTDCLEEILGFLTHKNPNVKGETIKFLVRCLRTTRDVPSKAEQKSIADASTKLLTESTEAMRSGGAEILGTLMKIIGERAMGPFLDGLDDIRKTKIKEYFDTAEVKAKDKPKPVAPPPSKAAGTSAVGKRVAAPGTRPAAKKAAPPPSPYKEEAAPPPKPTSKALPKPGGVPKPSLSQPSGLKLGGLKKPANSVPSPQPRRVISPPTSLDEDDATAPSPSKFGMNRGLAGRPLARPTAPPLSPPPTAPSGPSISSIQLAELDELRAEHTRLTTLTDDLRGKNTELTSKVSDLYNQNAQLIEDHTRDVLQIKAKETQLTRARGECDVLRSEMESLRKETERYKREVSRLGRESLGRDREDLIGRGRNGSHEDTENGIYEDQSQQQRQQDGRYSATPNGRDRDRERPTGQLSRAESGASVNSKGSGRVVSRPTAGAGAVGGGGRPGSTFTNNSLSPSDEKENNHFDGLAAARRKISPPVNGSGSGGGSPVRLERRGETERGDNGAAIGGEGMSGPQGQTENWKRAAEVTSQLKARIEAMKVRLNPNFIE